MKCTIGIKEDQRALILSVQVCSINHPFFGGKIRNVSDESARIDQHKLQYINRHLPPNSWPFFLEKMKKKIRKIKKTDFIIIMPVNNESWKKVSGKPSLCEDINDSPREHRESLAVWNGVDSSFPSLGEQCNAQRIMAIIFSAMGPFTS